MNVVQRTGQLNNGKGRRIWYGILLFAILSAGLVLIYLQLRPRDFIGTITSESGEAVTFSPEGTSGQKEKDGDSQDGESDYYDDFKQVYLMPGTWHLTIDARTEMQGAHYQVVDQQTGQIYAEGEYAPGEEYHAAVFTNASPIHAMVVRSYFPQTVHTTVEGISSENVDPADDNNSIEKDDLSKESESPQNESKESTEKADSQDLTIYGYTLEAEGAVCTDAKWTIVLLVQFLFLLGIGVFRFSKKGRPAFLILTILGGAASLPFLGNNMPLGHDLSFHLARIESLGYAIRDGQLPERINTAFAGHGNITPILYPELILFQSGFLCAQNTTVWFAYKAGMVFLTILTAWLSYAGTRAILGEKEALLFAFLYTMNPFRLNEIFLRAAVGEAFALAFLPLVLGGMVCLLDPLQNPRRGMILTVLGAFGLLSSHVLTTMVTAVFCLLSIILILLTHPLRYLKDRRRVVCLLLTLVFSVLCNLWFLIPFLEFTGGDYVVANQFSQLERETPYLWQFFMGQGARQEGKISAFSTTASTAGEMTYTIGPAMLVSAAAFVVLYIPLYIRGKRSSDSSESVYHSDLCTFQQESVNHSLENITGEDIVAKNVPVKDITHERIEKTGISGVEAMKENDAFASEGRVGLVCLLFGALSVFMASDFFPWTWLCNHFSLFRATFGQIQYRWRMLGFAMLFFTMCGVIAVRLSLYRGCRKEKSHDDGNKITPADMETAVLPDIGSNEETADTDPGETPAGTMTFSAEKTVTWIGNPKGVKGAAAGWALAAVLGVLTLAGAVQAGTEYYQNPDYSLSKWEHEQYVSPDYLEKEIYNQNGQEILEDQLSGKGPEGGTGVTVTGFRADGRDYSVSFEKTTGEESVITVPVLYYGLYQAERNGEKLETFMDPEEQFTNVTIPAGVQDGEIRLTFTEKPLYRFGDVVSIIAAVGFAASVFVGIRRKEAPVPNEGKRKE